MLFIGSHFQRRDQDFLNERLESLLAAIEALRSISGQQPAASAAASNPDEIVHKIPALGGNPQRVLIIASWRTGSTFLSELIASNLRNMRYFAYEPLLANFKNRVSSAPETQEAIDLLDNVMNCRYENVVDYRHYAMQVVHHRNPGLWDQMWDQQSKHHQTLQKLMRNRSFRGNSYP